MTVLYIVLICLSIVLFGIGFFIGKIEKREKKRHALFNSYTTKVETLDGDKKTSKKIDKPVIISSTLIEESLEMEDDEKKKK